MNFGWQDERLYSGRDDGGTSRLLHGCATVIGSGFSAPSPFTLSIRNSQYCDGRKSRLLPSSTKDQTAAHKQRRNFTRSITDKDTLPSILIMTGNINASRARQEE